jgi:pimeloyl-ACP methyl ester carboxylesterase
MKTRFLKIQILLFLTLLSCSKDNQEMTDSELLSTGSKKFVFTYFGLPQKPINVFYNIPSGDRKNMPIVIVFHGEERNAENYRNIWTDASNKLGFMVFAPEFNSVDFPGGSSYIIGNVYQDGNFPTAQTLNNESVWTFSIIEPLFDFIKTKTGTTVQSYDMFGHSGGGQFVHRFVLFKPNARFNKAIAANSGWFTVPDGVANYPYGIMNSPLSSITPNNYFSKQLYITVGELDNNNSDPSLRHNEASDLQGLNRLSRANYFYSKSQSFAQKTNSEYNWKFHIIPNSGHDATKMSNDAVKRLFP